MARKISHNVEPRIEEITLLVPHRLAEDVRAYTRRYQTSFSGMVNLVLSYYFGDGSDHLRCESCDLYDGQACLMEREEGEQLTIMDASGHRTLLDKGTVVVGQPSID